MDEAGKDESVFKYYRRLDRLRHHVESHLQDRLSLEDAASVVGLEAKYFSTYFRRSVGIGYKSWLDLIRVHRARELLARNDYSIGEVSELVGFRSVRTFERMFRKHNGETPRGYQFRKRPG
jgi:two-component system, response regulator YesN